MSRSPGVSPIVPLFRVAVLVALFGLAIAAPAAAQTPSTKLISFGIGGGVTVPVDNAEHAFDNGVNAHGFLVFNIPALPIQPRADFMFSKMDITNITFVDPILGASGNYTEGEQKIFAGLAEIQMTLLRAGPVQPYIMAGVGFANMNTKLEGDPNADNVSEDETQTVVNGGLGVMLKLGPIKGFVEGRLDNIMNDGELVDFDSVKLVPVSFGLVF